jgi:hypothetical protein
VLFTLRDTGLVKRALLSWTLSIQLSIASWQKWLFSQCF